MVGGGGISSKDRKKSGHPMPVLRGMRCGLPLDSVDSAADVRIPHKNRLSRLGAMFFHCRAGSASPLKAGDHDRKAERLLYRSLSAFDMDGCSEALNRGRYQMVCSQWPNAYWIFLRWI